MSAGVNRLKELRGEDFVRLTSRLRRDRTLKEEIDDVETGGTGGPVGDSTLRLLDRYTPIHKCMASIALNTKQIQQLGTKHRNTTTERQKKEVMAQLDKIMSSTNVNAALVKKTLDDIKIENRLASEDEIKRQAEGTAQSQIRANIYAKNVRDFHHTMQEYNEATHAFKKALTDRTHHELKIVDKDLSDDQIDAIIESGKAQEVIKQAIISDNLKSVVADIEERHLDIMKLESQVLEIFELFKDLAQMVDLQQESLDVISERIVKAKGYAEKGLTEVQDAEEYQRKAFRRKCCLLFIILGVLVAILAPTLLKTLKKS